MQYSDGTAQELVPLGERELRSAVIDGVLYPAALWQNPDCTSDNPHPPRSSALADFLQGYTAELLAGTYRPLEWGREYAVKTNAGTVPFRVYTEPGSSSAVYRYRFLFGDHNYSMNGYSAGGSGVILSAEDYAAAAPLMSGTYFLLRAGDGRLLILHSWSLDGPPTYYIRMEWFLFPDSIGLTLQTQCSGLGERHGAFSSFSEQVMLSENAFTDVSVCQPARGTWYGAGIRQTADGETVLSLLRYRYEKRLDPLLVSGSYRTENGDPASKLSLSLVNAGHALFFSEASLFVPGAKLTLGVRAGDSEVYPITVSYLEKLGYDALSGQVSVFAENTLGFRLGNQVFDSDFAFEGSVSAAAEAVLDYFGIRSYAVDETDEAAYFRFPAGSTGLEALETIEETMSSLDNVLAYAMWKTAETPDGTVLCGYEPFLADYLPNSEFRVSLGRDVFSYRVSRSSENVYTRVRAVGTDADGLPLDTVLMDVTHDDTWDPGEHRVYQVRADHTDRQTLAQIAKNNALLLRNIGEVTEMTVTLQPQVLIGDFARFSTEDNVSHDAGIITSVCHRFGPDGFFTDITADSGGGLWYFGNRMATRALPIERYRRKEELQRLLGIR